jgi:hypothetical protein
MFGGVRILKHEVVPQSGSFEVRFADCVFRGIVSTDFSAS